MQVAPRSSAASAGFMPRAWYLLQIVPAFLRRLVALARELDFLLELRLAPEVLVGRPAAAAGSSAQALAGLRLDALVTALLGVLEREVGGARLLVGLVELGAAVLCRSGRSKRESCED